MQKFLVSKFHDQFDFNSWRVQEIHQKARFVKTNSTTNWDLSKTLYKYPFFPALFSLCSNLRTNPLYFVKFLRLEMKLFKKFFWVSPRRSQSSRRREGETKPMRTGVSVRPRLKKTVGARGDGAESANCFNKAATERRTVVGSGNWLGNSRPAVERAQGWATGHERNI